MAKFRLKDVCDLCVSYGTQDDKFVGLSVKDDKISIRFPMGYHFDEQVDNISDEHMRREILLLLSTLVQHTHKVSESDVPKEMLDLEEQAPLFAYIYILKDYFERGYYQEQETVHKIAKTGKINWGRTIRTQKPLVQKNSVIYLDFVVKKNNINETAIITMIHKYCVYSAFKFVGWLFTSYVPQEPFKLTSNLADYFIQVIKNKLSTVFNDRHKILFINMLAILEYESKNIGNIGTKEYRVGVNRFEYIWESMIDTVYGVSKDERQKHNPFANWYLGETLEESTKMRPDTIMKKEGTDAVYILDAKYYRYYLKGKIGVDDESSDLDAGLPTTADINKQVTYGEYIEYSKELAPQTVENGRLPIYNAFILPFDKNDVERRKSFWEVVDEEGNIFYVGQAKLDWKDERKPYTHIQAYLMDVKHLMKIASGKNNVEIERLAELMEKNWKCEK